MENVKKKILLLSTGDVNGAYEAIYRVATILINDGHDVKLVVKEKTRFDSFIITYTNLIKKRNIVHRGLAKIRMVILNKIKSQKSTVLFDNNYLFISRNEENNNISPEALIKQVGFCPDFIISGMTNGFINSTDIYNLQKITKAKVFNITVDMNHFTGGCHYAWDCQGYIKGCNENCPAILSDEGMLIAKENFEIKLKNARNGNFKAIAMSLWTLNQIEKSKIYKDQSEKYNINSIIDLKVFNNCNRNIAKDIFGFDNSKFYILAGCQSSKDIRKGFSYFIDSLTILESKLTKSQKEKIVIIVVSREVPKEFEAINFEKQKLDYINDYRLLSLLYQSIDLFVNTSIEDSGPMMVSEALACGTPVVGFDMGIVTNVVINGLTGYKSRLKDSNDLAEGIKLILDLSKDEYLQYSNNANEYIKKHSSYEFVSNEFRKIFNEN
ncbi:glycosyltransferase [Flavobacterium sp.]|jgi:glycosyltransferase involved in cell wall biosynthesis|uniref:glycosyltransferase n=2 Tax=Flavobacterium sp. TaxID=239 RepID=UPI0022C53A76|nr:glycosyltransferase [Flavobacterium sp.]MCZ8169791.1 glycosyltransferase [Flavobacterium sp.]